MQPQYTCVCVCVTGERENDKANGAKCKPLVNLGKGIQKLLVCLITFSLSLTLCPKKSQLV